MLPDETRPMTLTPKQSEMLEYILRFRSDHGHDPTYGQMAIALGERSKSSVWYRREALIRIGALDRRS